MNIRSLLLGSAAVLAGASGAQAADAVVVAEPEPVEYVRVCDVYGTGFFYIPGTETCLQISGEVYYQIGADDIDDGWVKTTHAQVNFDARSQTEWGMLRGWIRLQAEWGGSNDAAFWAPDPAANPFGDGPLVVDQAVIELGGLRMGYYETAFVEAQYGEISWGGTHSDTALSYGDQQRHQIAYSFHTDNGFFGTLSLEDDALQGDGYIPDFVGVVGVEQGWGGVWAKGAYDESAEELATNVGLQFNVPNMEGSSFRLIGFYESGSNQYDITPYFVPDGISGTEWSLLASYNHQFTPNFGASIAAQYFSDLYVADTDISSGLNAWQAELSLVWTPVENFEIRGEAFYVDIDDVGDDEDSATGGYLRFTRFF